MAKAGFCRQCGKNVWLASDDSCINGHGRNMVSGIYETDQATFPPPPVPGAAGNGSLPIILGVLGVSALVVIVAIGILAAIAIPVFDSAKVAAQKKTCFANQRFIEGAVMQYLAADEGREPPRDYAHAVAAIVPTYARQEPRCPNGGIYSLRLSGDSLEIPCSIHGSYAEAGASPSAY